MSTPLKYSPPGTPSRRVHTTADFKVLASTSQVQGLRSGDLLDRPAGYFHNLFKAILATAVFRCWYFIIAFTIEAAIVTYVHSHGIKDLAIQNTLMGVLGTVLGFVISYRSSSGFDRYNEGRKYWSQIVYNIRMFSRVVWFNLPDEPTGNIKLEPAKTIEEFKARALVEKKTILNLLLAFAVSLKHYLRGEEGSHYEDLYHLVRFLPAYELPAGYEVKSIPSKKGKASHDLSKFQNKMSTSNDALPLPATDSTLRNRTASTVTAVKSSAEEPNVIYLSPARNPPPYHVFDFWPMSMFVRSLQKRGKRVKGRKALRDYARNNTEGNMPLEVSLYLSSYIASMMKRGADGSTTGQMSGALGQMVDALTGLERILQTPIPFSYSVHLWTVTLVWLVALPFQILEPLGWLTIPGTALAAFVYCGLMKCAEELENPFGYDYNDLNLDHFTHNIIRKELRALTSLAMPDPLNWAFSAENDAVFDNDGNAIYVSTNDPDVASPNQWVQRGEKDIRAALAKEDVSELEPTSVPVRSTASVFPPSASDHSTGTIPPPPASVHSRPVSIRTQASGSVPVPPPGHFSMYSKKTVHSSSNHGIIASGAIAGATIDVGNWVETTDPSGPGGADSSS